MFNTCKSINDILYLYRRNQLLSCVTRINWGHFVVVMGGKDANLVSTKMLPKHKFKIERLSIHFHGMKIDLSMTKLDLISLNQDEI